jgi:hypothetical protein
MMELRKDPSKKEAASTEKQEGKEFDQLLVGFEGSRQSFE